MEKIEKIEKIKPSGIFTNYIFKAIPLAFDESLSYYEMLCGLLKKVKTIEEVVNNHADIIKELEEFVAHYFDNLDVQEEINNKLDEMAESGELAEIINEEIFNNLNNEVKHNKVYELSDNVQNKLYKKLDNLFTPISDWGISSIIITTINGNEKGIAVANDWSVGGSEGTKFSIVTFNYEDDTPYNIITRANLLDGHANSMCLIGNNKVFICANGYNYIYDLSTNNYTTVTDTLPYFSGITNDDEGNFYATQPYDSITGDTINKLYMLEIDNENDTVTVLEQKTIPNLNEKLGGNSQGCVAYNGLLIFPSFAPAKLCIYDIKTLDYLKTQLITAPYLTECEDGFIYKNKLIIVDSLGNMFEPDIYGKNSIGDYNHNNIIKSLDNICLLDTPRIINIGATNNLKFTNYMSFGNLNVNTDIGTIGTQLESIDLYFGISLPDETRIYACNPITINTIRNLTNANLQNKQEQDITSYLSTYNIEVMLYEDNNPFLYKMVIEMWFTGGTSNPTFGMLPYTKILKHDYSNSSDDILTYSTDIPNLTLYLLKMVGHRKVSMKY